MALGPAGGTRVANGVAQQMMSGRAISANRGSTLNELGSYEHSDAGRDGFEGGERARRS